MNGSRDDWTLKKWQSDKSLECRLFRKNLAPVIQPRDPEYPFLAYLTFTYEPRDASGLPTMADEDELIRVEKEEIPLLEEEGLAVLVGVVVKGGVKDFIFYTCDVEEFRFRTSQLIEKNSHLRVECSVEEDPAWSQYEDLP
jgi:hypothetical protein